MFVRINSLTRSSPVVNYINTSNVLRMKVENNCLSIYTIFRPKYSAHTVIFRSNEQALSFVDQCIRKPRGLPPTKLDRIDQATPDMLAMSAMENWEQETQLK